MEHRFQSAERHRRVNTALTVVLMLMVAGLMWLSVVNRRELKAVAGMATSNTTSIAEVKANQDLYRQQYLDYIKDTIEAMNKLQADNSNPEEIKKRGIKVPKAPVPRPLIPHTGVTENELQRLPQPGPSPPRL